MPGSSSLSRRRVVGARGLRPRPGVLGWRERLLRLLRAVGGSPQGVIHTLFTDPGAIAAALVTSRDLVYVVALALPLAGLFVLAPGLALAALPQLAENGARRADGDDRSASALHGCRDPDPGRRGRRRDGPAVRSRSGGRREGDPRPLSRALGRGRCLAGSTGQSRRVGHGQVFVGPCGRASRRPSRSCRTTRL